VSDVAGARGVSEALAEFTVAAHAGAGFEHAAAAARALLRSADAPPAADRPETAAEQQQRAAVRNAVGAAYAPPMLRAFDAAHVASARCSRSDGAIVTAALAAASLRGADETVQARAVAVGREVTHRLRSALRLDPAWDATAVTSRIGAAAAAACAAGLDAGAARHAIGIAATQASGLGVAEGGLAGALACGKIAGDAVEAAVLAGHGFTSAAASLEGRRGLAPLMASAFDARAVTEGLGERWLSAQ
jgi:2-methylcitrate dehydratase PrpD